MMRRGPLEKARENRLGRLAEEQLPVYRQIRSTIAKLIRAARRVLRERYPTANELVYDNYNFFVIGYCATERPSDCLFSIPANAKGSACRSTTERRCRTRTGFSWAAEARPVSTVSKARKRSPGRK